MKSFRASRKAMAIGIAALLLFLCGYAGAVSDTDTDLPVFSKPTVVTPSNTQAVRLVAGTGSIGVERLPAIQPVERPIAAAPAKAQVINVLSIRGTVTVVSGGTEMPAYAGMRLSAGDKLTTVVNSRATLDLNNGGMVMVESNSEIEITQSTAEYIEVSLLSGNIINNIEKGAGKYAVKANNVTMGVLGTVFRVKLNGGIASVDLYEGSVSVTLVGDGGEEHSFDLGAGMSFEGTDETILNSIEKGALETGELDLDELPDYVVDWIAQSLEDREQTVDDPEMLKKLINALHQQIAERRQDDPPAAPPAGALPASPPAPVQPNLMWGNASMAGIESGGKIVDYSLAMSWRVENSTIPWGYGSCWSYDDWNTNETTDNTDSFYTYNGIRYYLSTYTGWETGNFTVTAQNLKGPFETAATPVDELTLNVILIPEVFDKDPAHVFGHNAVVVKNQTPDITVDESASAGMSIVTVTPTNEIVDYEMQDADTRDPISIPVDEPNYEITNEAAQKIVERTAYPEGETNGVAVGSSAGDTITVDVFMPTIVDPPALGEP